MKDERLCAEALAAAHSLAPGTELRRHPRKTSNGGVGLVAEDLDLQFETKDVDYRIVVNLATMSYERDL